MSTQKGLLQTLSRSIMTRGASNHVASDIGLVGED